MTAAVDEETQAFSQLANLKIIDDSATKKENLNLVSIGHVGISFFCLQEWRIQIF